MGLSLIERRNPVAYHVEITPGTMHGTVRVPPSKSLLHRALFCAAFADGISTIGPRHDCEDILDTINALRALGASIEILDDSYRVTGIQSPKSSAHIRIEASATTLRFLIPVLAATQTRTTITLGPTLTTRPLTSYLTFFASHLTQEGNTLNVDASLPETDITLRDLESSQVVSGFLLARAITNSRAAIHIDNVPSSGYVDLTARVLEEAGVSVARKGNTLHVDKGSLSPFNLTAEGDASHASLWLAAGVLGHRITVENFPMDSRQIDAVFLKILSDVGAILDMKNGAVTAFSSVIAPFDLDIDGTPDLAFALAIIALKARGPCSLRGIKRLKIKESDRITAIADTLRKCGVTVVVDSDALTIHPTSSLKGEVRFASLADHRVAMMATVLASRAMGPVVIQSADAIMKSYPDFYKHCRALGLTIHERKDASI